MTDRVSHDDLQRSLGRVEGHQAAMETRLDRLEKLVSEGFEKLDARLASMEGTERERKGALKVAAGVAATVGAMAGAAVKYLLG